MKNPIDEHFAKGLESLEVKPSADLWKNKIQPQVQPKKKTPVIWYRAAAVIILLLSGLFAIKYFGSSPQPSLNPEDQVAIEEVVLPEVLVTATVDDEETPLKEQSVDEVQSFEKAPVKQIAKLNVKEEPRVLAELEPQELPVENANDGVQEKKKYKVKLSLNTLKYASAEPQVEEKSENFRGYAKDQWENIKSGDGLDSPPKDWFTLPKVKLDGNPLKGVLASKGE